jgi:hypothetical protein
VDSGVSAPEALPAFSESLPARFASKVGGADARGCLPWLGAVQSSGYGSVGLGTGKTALAHRVAYEMARGAIPAGMTIDHLCRNTLCVNPDHMEVVPRAVNIQRAAAAKTHCHAGHPLSGANLYGTAADGKRRCRECRRATNRRYEAKQRAVSP